jgi:hypothetical protein
MFMDEIHKICTVLDVSYGACALIISIVVLTRIITIIILRYGPVDPAANQLRLVFGIALSRSSSRPKEEVPPIKR